jgi:hypothetical protein
VLAHDADLAGVEPVEAADLSDCLAHGAESVSRTS